MFDSLSSRLAEVFDRLKRRGALSESDVGQALRDIRIALLEADVALPVAKQFIAQVKERAMGAEVVRSVTPGQMVVKIVHDRLIEMLGGGSSEINLATSPPAGVMLVGLQGSGKTTTTAKLGKRLMEGERKRVLMASLDGRRPAAQKQLAVLGREIGVRTLAVNRGETAPEIARSAIETGRLEGYDVVLLDTGGRLHIDDEMMAEAVAVRDATRPSEILLVADALTGQDAVTLATAFKERLNITGIALTRVDGDARGGAALSMRAVTGCPIKLIGVGEKVDALEAFHPERIASRILGMGDVVSLVEKAAQTIEREEAERLARKLEKGRFDLDDLAAQLRQVRKMGGMEGMLAMLPGVARMKKELADARIDERMLRRQEAIVNAMTRTERKHVKILNASRKRRIAAGSGTSVQEVNRLLKQFHEMTTMVKKVNKLGKKGLMRHGLPGAFPPHP